MANALTQRQMMIEQIKKSQELAALGNELYDARSSVFNSPSTTPTTPTPIQPNAGLGAPITPTPKQTTTPATQPPATQPPATQPVASGMNQPSTVPAGVPLPDEDKYLVEPTSAMAGSSKKPDDTLSGFISFITDWGKLSDTQRKNFGNVKHGNLTEDFSLGPDPNAKGGASGMAMFDSVETSEKAMHSLWSSDFYNRYPIAEMIRKAYNPSFAQGNTPEGVIKYINEIRKRTGIDIDNLKYNDLSTEQKAILRAAQADLEHATGRFYLDQTLSGIAKKNKVESPEELQSLPSTGMGSQVDLREPKSVPETTTAQPMAALSAPATKPMDTYAPFNPLETLKYKPSDIAISPELRQNFNNPQFPDRPYLRGSYNTDITLLENGFIALTSPDGEKVVLRTETTPETATPEQLEWFKKHTDHDYKPFIEYSNQFKKPKTETPTSVEIPTSDATTKSSEPDAQTQPSPSNQPEQVAQPTTPTEPAAQTQPIAKPSQSGYSKNLVEYRNKVIAYQRKAMELYALTRDPQYSAMGKQAEEQLLSAFQNVATKSFLSGDSEGLRQAFSAMYGGEGPEIKIEKLSDGTYGASLYNNKDKVMELHASQIYNIGNPTVLAQAEQAYALKLGAIQMQNRAKAEQIELKQRGAELSRALAVGTNPTTGARVALNNNDDIADWINAFGKGSVVINQQAAAAAARAESLRNKNSLWRSMDGQPVSETTAKEILQVFQEINKNPSAYTINGKPYTMSELISLIQKRFGIVFQGKIPDQGTITEMTFDEDTGNIVTRKTAIN
jgi:hypothetical protein